MAEHGSWHPGYVVLQDRQCSPVIIEHKVGNCHYERGPQRVERIEPDVGLEHVDCPPRISGKGESQAEAPVHVVWVERDGSFELGYGNVVLPHPREYKTEHRMRFG